MNRLQAETAAELDALLPANPQPRFQRRSATWKHRKTTAGVGITPSTLLIFVEWTYQGDIFSKTELPQRDFRRAILRQAEFVECDLKGANFADADVRNSRSKLERWSRELHLRLGRSFFACTKRIYWQLSKNKVRFVPFPCSVMNHGENGHEFEAPNL